MFETLMEIMEPKINEIRKEEKQEGIQEGMQKGIRGAIEMLRNLQYQDIEIRSEIMKQYGLTEDEATDFLQS